MQDPLRALRPAVSLKDAPTRVVEARGSDEETSGSSGLDRRQLDHGGTVNGPQNSERTVDKATQAGSLTDICAEPACPAGDRDGALLWEAVHRLAKVVSSVDSKVSELTTRLCTPQQAAHSQHIGSPSHHSRPTPSCSGGGDTTIANDTFDLAQQLGGLKSSAQGLQSQLKTVTEQLQRIGSTQKELLQQQTILQQQVLKQQQVLQDQLQGQGTQSFRAHANCYDVAVLADDNVLLATNKGVREYSCHGRELSRFLREDLAVAVDAFGYDGFVAVLLKSNEAVKARSSSDKAKQPCTTVVIMSRNASHSSAEWVEEGRFLVTPEVACLSTVPDSGDLLVACGLGKPDVYSFTRSGVQNFQMKAGYGVKAIAATSTLVVIASSDAQADGGYVVGAYSNKGTRLMWQWLCKDQVHDLCCDPWGGLYAAIRDKGAVMVVSCGRQSHDDQSGCYAHDNAMEVVGGLTKPAYLSMDSRGRRLVVLSYDGRVVNALSCKTMQVELNPVV